MLRPSNDIIAKVYAQEGSIRRTARALGYAESTLRFWAKDDRELAAVFQMDHYSSASRDVTKDAEIRALRKTNKELNEIVGKREKWLDEVIEAARLPRTAPTFTLPLGDTRRPSRAIVLPIFDVQYGQHVNPQDVPFGKGGFSEEIFDQRLEMYVDKVAAFLLDRNESTDFTEINIVLGGDLVEGDQIFRGQAWQLQTHPVRQVLDLRNKLGAALRSIIWLAKNELGVQRVRVFCVPGNHGKVGGKLSGATPSDYSWDYLVSQLILDDLREEPIDIAINEASGAVLFDSLGHTFLVVHGDEIKGVMGIPFYGLAKADGRYIRMSEVIHDYLLLGHHHQPADIPNGSGGSALISGDWVGANNLSRAIMAGSRPQQNVLLISAKHGLVEQARIYLDGADRRKRPLPVIHGA